MVENKEEANGWPRTLPLRDITKIAPLRRLTRFDSLSGRREEILGGYLSIRAQGMCLVSFAILAAYTYASQTHLVC